jgi:phytoene dehydrogenase-like protein
LTQHPQDEVDAAIIGSGPNGLAAAAYLARAGWSVAVLERSTVAGGAVGGAELTLPGYVHDRFSGFYGLLHASPVFSELGLDERIRWHHFTSPVAALISPEEAGVIRQDPRDTAEGLSRMDPSDGRSWEALYGWWRKTGRRMFDALLQPVGAMRTGLRFASAARVKGGLETAKMQMTTMAALAQGRFASEAARAVTACGITHSDLSVEEAGSVTPALILAMLAQEVGMPVPEGGAGKLAEALVAIVEEAGGSVRTGAEVTKVVTQGARAVGVETAAGGFVRARRAVLADTGPLALFRDLVGEDRVPSSYLKGLQEFRYGSGVFKMDLALSGPVPWVAEGLGLCGVVHVSGDLSTMARSAFQIGRGELPTDPLLIVGQQSVADPTRASEGNHTLWIECHVPSHPTRDAAGIASTTGAWDASTAEAFADRVLERIEQHAPGFRSLVVGQAVQTPADLEAANPNLVGGDIGGGSSAIDQQLIFRPVPGWFRYRTPVKSLYLCSASTHPGGGVHGMCGRNAAHRVMRDSHLTRLGR